MGRAGGWTGGRADGRMNELAGGMSARPAADGRWGELVDKRANGWTHGYHMAEVK